MFNKFIAMSLLCGTAFAGTWLIDGAEAPASLRQEQTGRQDVVNGGLAVEGRYVYESVADPSELYSSPAYSEYYDLYGASDNGSYSDTSAGNFQDQSFTIRVYPYGTSPYGLLVASYYADISLSDYSSTPFQLQLSWQDYGGENMSTAGYYVQIEDGVNTYWTDAGNVTSLQVSDFTGWNSGTLTVSDWAPYQVAAGNLYGENHWYLYAKREVDGKVIFSVNAGSRYDADYNYYWANTLYWYTAEGATSYILYNETAGYWIETQGYMIQDNGDYSLWNYGTPEVTPVSPLVEIGDLFTGSNANVRVKLNGLGQFETDAGTGTSPLKVNSPTLNENLNADLLDGYHSGAFQPAGDYVTGVTASGSLTAGRQGSLITLTDKEDSVLKLDYTTNSVTLSYDKEGNASILSLYSTKWIQSDLGFTDIAYNGNVIAKTVWNDGIWYSLDGGQTWKKSNYSSGTYARISYTNGVWHVKKMTSNYRLSYSLTGTNWLEVTPSVAPIAGSEYYHNMPRFIKDKWFIGYLGINYSLNGTNFTGCSVNQANWDQYPGITSSIEYDSVTDTFMIPSCGGSTRSQPYKSVDGGLTWTRTSYLFKGDGSILSTKDRWYYFPGNAYLSTLSPIYYTTDRQNWQTLPNSPQGLWGFCFTKGASIFISNGSTPAYNLYSADSGTNWVQVPSLSVPVSGFESTPEYWIAYTIGSDNKTTNTLISFDLFNWYQEPSFDRLLNAATTGQWVFPSYDGNQYHSSSNALQVCVKPANRRILTSEYPKSDILFSPVKWNGLSFSGLSFKTGETVPVRTETAPSSGIYGLGWSSSPSSDGDFVLRIPQGSASTNALFPDFHFGVKAHVSLTNCTAPNSNATFVLRWQLAPANSNYTAFTGMKTSTVSSTTAGTHCLLNFGPVTNNALQGCDTLVIRGGLKRIPCPEGGDAPGNVIVDSLDFLWPFDTFGSSSKDGDRP
jgi:hypothetical protein